MSAGILEFLYWFSISNYLLFHLVVEIAGIVLALAIFLIAINTHRLSKNDYFTFLSISYFFVSLIQFFHLVSYRGMNIIEGLTANPATQLWIFSRYMFSVSLLASGFLIGRKLKVWGWYALVLAQIGLVGWILRAVFSSSGFPDAYVEGRGLTDFKIISEYVIIAIFALAAAVLWRKRHLLDRTLYGYLQASIVASVLAELSFTKYVSVYGGFNMVGHFLVVLSGFFMYKAFVQKTLNEPIATLFRGLQDANSRLTNLAQQDVLTNLFNRRHALGRIEEQFKIAKRFGKPFTIMMLDVDNLKRVNETYGHVAGDKVLSAFSAIIGNSIRKVDIAGRYGGDEFIVCPLEADIRETTSIAESIIKSAEKITIEEGNEKITFSASAGICHANGFENLWEIIEIADGNLRDSKRRGKNLVTVTERIIQKA